MKRFSHSIQPLVAILCALWVGMPFSYAQLGMKDRSIDRELRYAPDSSDFVFCGSQPKMFNRALYGNNQSFRLETSDIPEFGFYGSAGMMGNVQFAIKCGQQMSWLTDLQSIQCRYRPGIRIYQLRDSLLGKGQLLLEAIARYDKEGALFRIESTTIPDSLELICLYGGVRGKKFSRNGDMGVDPDDAFSLKKDYCRYNRYIINKNDFRVFYEFNHDLSLFSDDELMTSTKATWKNIQGHFPDHTTLSIGNASYLSSPEELMAAAADNEYPVLRATWKMHPQQSVYIAFEVGAQEPILASSDKQDSMDKLYKATLDSIEQIAGHLKIYTPDPFFNTLGGAVSMAADGIWESPSYHHGAIGWRSRLAGWRGAYTGDVLGWHDRAREHFRAYAASQMTLPPDKAVIMDTALNIARSAKVLGTPMYSEGYIARYPNSNTTMNHYDMNLCYIDELLWHLCWTGDVDFAKEIWPVLTRHLAWEKRCFDADNDGLYDAYCCIWASDALQYSGGGVTHSSAYNYRANAMAAEIASLIGENPQPYEEEADKILQAINQQLWIDKQGHWAEFKDVLGNKLLHPSAGLWTIYHAIDSDIHDSFKAYQALRYVDTEIPHIPIKTIPSDSFHIEPELAVISTTNWMPYYWSINNVVFAEMMHTALAYFQGGRHEQACRLMKSAIMDGMYLGGSPGNIGQISFYDASRGEAYRDFADPVGVYSRCLVQGLFGVNPDLLHHTVFLRPAFPASWDTVCFETPDIQYSYRRFSNGIQSWRILPRFEKEANLVFEIPIRHNNVWMATVNGSPAKGQFDKNAIGQPILRIFCGKEAYYHIEIQESNQALPHINHPSILAIGEEIRIDMPQQVEMLQLHDPQHILTDVGFSPKSLTFKPCNNEGQHSFFIEIKNEHFSWWQAIDIELRPLLEILRNEKDTSVLSFYIRNNSFHQDIEAELRLNDKKYLSKLSFPPRSTSDYFYIAAPQAVHGSNVIQLKEGKTILQEAVVCCWDLPFDSTERQQMVPIDAYFNDRLNNTFAFGKYKQPRSPFTTLQLPWQGYGDWCGPKQLPLIDDKGLRSLAGKENQFKTPQGIFFATPSDTTQNNVVYVSQWDNYPTEIDIPLAQKAKHAYLLMAGTTNHMQCNLTNGMVIAQYSDNTADTLCLNTPENWIPIEQNYFIDNMAFRINADRPYRLHLLSGEVTKEASTTQMIPGGAAIILDLPLDAKKKLHNIRMVSITNENVIGLLSLTLIL